MKLPKRHSLLVYIHALSLAEVTIIHAENMRPLIARASQLEVAELFWGVLLVCLGQLPLLCFVVLHGGFDRILSEHAAVELHRWKRQVLCNLTEQKRKDVHV
jgi:hypothetical protein